MTGKGNHYSKFSESSIEMHYWLKLKPTGISQRKCLTFRDISFLHNCDLKNEARRPWGPTSVKTIRLAASCLSSFLS